MSLYTIRKLEMLKLPDLRRVFGCNFRRNDSVKNKLSFWRPDLRQIRASRFRKTAGVVVLH